MDQTKPYLIARGDKELCYRPGQRRSYVLSINSLLGADLLKTLQGLKKALERWFVRIPKTATPQSARVLFVQDQAQT